MKKAQAIYESMMETDFYSQWLGIKPLLIEEGVCHLEMTVRKEMLNGFGILHGGVAYALADSAQAFAANGFGRIAPLINANMSYSKSAREGDVLRAEAKVIAIGNKKADVDVTLYCNEEEEPYYFFRGTAYRTSREHELKEEIE